MGDGSSSFWVRWHADYDDPDSDLSQRLSVVQMRIREAVEWKPPGPIRLVSACAGQGRDVIGALAGHRRSGDVEALLIESEDHNVERARLGAADAGLRIEVVHADAGITNAYEGGVPADVLLLCGIFGNVSNEDVQTTVRNASRLCARDAVAIWTRKRSSPDLTSSIRGWFEDAGFDETAFDSPGRDRFAVGTCRLRVDPLPFRPGQRLFSFL